MDGSNNTNNGPIGVFTCCEMFDVGKLSIRSNTLSNKAKISITVLHTYAHDPNNFE